MNELWKKRARASLRIFEVLLAVALLAVLIELLLVFRNAPGPLPEIRIIRSQQPPEAASSVVPKPEALPVPPAAPVPERKAAQAPPVPRRPEGPVLLDFENLRRLLGITKPATVTVVTYGGGGDGANDFADGPRTVTVLLIATLNPVIIGPTNAALFTNSLPTTNGASGVISNQVATVAANTRRNGEPPVFRLSVP
jgi:hypothetical protein